MNNLKNVMMRILTSISLIYDYMRRKYFEVRNNHKNILVIFNYLPNATYPTYSTPFLRQIIYFLSYNILHIPHKHVA